ncbi:MAG: hypothetical protein JSS21_04035 [Proteobacteria bacterium]|nr:hypothetical protein [Pseudomonadota bacterium]
MRTSGAGIETRSGLGFESILLAGIVQSSMIAALAMPRRIKLGRMIGSRSGHPWPHFSPQNPLATVPFDIWRLVQLTARPLVGLSRPFVA